MSHNYSISALYIYVMHWIIYLAEIGEKITPNIVVIWVKIFQAEKKPIEIQLVRSIEVCGIVI